MKKRFLIYVVYDFEGYIEDYVKYMLKSIRQYYDKIVVVVNGSIQKEGLLFVENNSEQVIIRENYGFDGGAYKEAFLNDLKNEDWSRWDELTMMNDTFYGPIYPMEEVFEIMDEKRIDFWGMTKLEKGIWNDGARLPENVQSYFLSVRRDMLISQKFMEFWRDYQTSNDFDETILRFEVGFTNFFRDNGFSYAAYTDYKKPIDNQDKSENIWEKYPYELLKDIRMPFVKRKIFGVFCYREAVKVLDYINTKTEYDVNLIYKHINRLAENGKLIGKGNPYDKKRLDDFVACHSKIYLYGNGNVSKRLKDYFEATGTKISGIIVSKKNGMEETICIDDFDMTEGIGIVIAVGKKYLIEVRTNLETRRVRDCDVFSPKYT